MKPPRFRGVTGATIAAGRRSRGGGRARLDDESGYVLVLTTVMMVPLLMFTAFTVDLGSWFAQGARMQRAVDAAALAGVVQLPNTANAVIAANATLAANGFDPVTYVPTFAYPTSAGVEMSVTISAPAAQYFSTTVVKGKTLTRTATALYNLRIPLGSPGNVFGNDLVVGGPQPNIWAAINGPYSNHSDGDPYSGKCAVGPASATTCSGAANTTYRNTGYLWAIDVPQALVGGPVTVSIYDPAFGPNAAIAEGYSGTSNVFSTSYQIFDNSGSAVSIDLSAANGLDVAGSCTDGTPGYQVFAGGLTAGAVPTPNTKYTNAWYPLCTFVPTVAGIYPVQVKTSGIPTVTDRGGGWNAYSIKAESAGNVARAYAMSELSVWTPTPAASAKFYLANIDSQYASHTLVVDLFDPGDGSDGDFFLQVLQPPAGAPANPPITGTPIACLYSAPSTNVGGTATIASPNCRIQTRVDSAGTPNIYNNKWLRISITLPTSYTCAGDCWWTVSYEFIGTSAGSPPTDRTVWVVNVVGDPVHLIN